MIYIKVCLIVIVATHVAAIIYTIIAGKATKRYTYMQSQKYSNIPGGMGGYFGTRKNKFSGGKASTRVRSGSSYGDDFGGGSSSSSDDDTRHVIEDTARGISTDQYGYTYDTWGNPLDQDNPRGHL